MANPTAGEFLFDYLYDKGVTHAFGLPGDFALPLFRWLDRSKIKLITMTHEPSVGFAADGYARMKGLGVACVTYCVGGLNLVNPVACAYAEKSRVLVISGGPGINDRRLDPLLHHKVRTFDTQRRIFEEVTCATAVLLDAATAASEIMRVGQASGSTGILNVGGGAGACTCWRAGVGPNPKPWETVCVALPFGITTIIGLALPSAIRLSRMKLARPCQPQPVWSSPAPCSRYKTG